MQLSEYAAYDAIGLAELIASGQVSAAEVADAARRAVQYADPQVNAVIEVWSEETAAEPEEGSVLAGVPFLIKDLGVGRAGRLSELGSRLAAGVRAPADSTLMQRFRRAGLLTIGRTTTPEFGISTTTESEALGPTRNPWDPGRSAGGSSGGAAAAVAAGMVPMAHATDGGGSIRVPASANGLFGLKPTRGRVSNGPAVDEVWSGLAVQLGVSRSVRDSAALLDAVHGGGIGEPYEIAAPARSFLVEAQRDPQPLRIGLMLDPLNGTQTTPAVAEVTQAAARLCEGLGHEVIPVQPDLGVSWEAFTFANARFWTVNTTAWIDAIAAAASRKPGPDVLEPATLAVYQYGRTVGGLDLLGALDVRNTVTRAIGAFFQSFDVLLTPTLPDLPPAIGAYNEGQERLDALGWIDRVFGFSPFTALANVAGVPAMSVPLGMDSASGLPVGSMFAAGFGREAVLFNLAGQLERAQPWRDRRPAVWAGN